MHRMDAVSKLIWLLAMTGLVVVGVRAIENILLFVWLVFIGVVLGRLPLFTFLRRVAPLLILSVWLLAVMSALYPRGENLLVELGPVTVTFEGLDYGMALFFRVLALGTASVIFTLTTDPRRMINELIEIGRLPYRWAYGIYAALRFIPLLQTEARNIMNAHAVRGALEKKRSVFNIIRPIRRLTIPLLIGGLRRVQITAIAMDSRAFGAYEERTNLDPVQRPRGGLIFAGLHVIGFVVFLVWRLVYGGGGLLIAPIA